MSDNREIQNLQTGKIEKVDENWMLTEAVKGMPKPLHTDKSPFGIWLRKQLGRKNDAIGALARVANQDPTWPGGWDIKKLRTYFRQMGARDFVMASLDAAWREHEKSVKKTKNRIKKKAQKAARKNNRRKK